MVINMKKRIFAFLAASMLVLMCGVFASASETGAGGYPYLKENGQIDFAGYFDTKGVDIKMSQESMDFVLTKKQATVTFRKKLAADGFRMGFSGVKNNNLSKAEFVLTDAESPEKTITVVYYNMSDSQTAVSVNKGGRSYLIDGSMNKQNDNDFRIGYDDDTRCVDDGSELFIRVKSNMDGSGFTGFPSKTVNLTIRLYGSVGSVFRLKELNYQRFGKKYTEDTTEPMVCVSNPIAYTVKGAVIPLEQVFAVDVLAEKATVTVTVRNPEREIVTATDGTKLEEIVPDKQYYIEIKDYGDYWIDYKATDGKNGTHMLSRQIRVMDVTAPKLTLGEDMEMFWKVGDTVTFPKMTYSDNRTDEENVVSWVTVKHPNGVITAEQEKVKLMEKGVYEISFMAMDETGNISTVTEKICAEEKNDEK